jgi:hypothetical protein
MGGRLFEIIGPFSPLAGDDDPIFRDGILSDLGHILKTLYEAVFLKQ